jgi:hypothetical protein
MVFGLPAHDRGPSQQPKVNRIDERFGSHRRVDDLKLLRRERLDTAKIAAELAACIGYGRALGPTCR